MFLECTQGCIVAACQAIAGALGRRAATLPELQDDLFRAAADLGYQGAWPASMLWLKHAPDRDARTARLLRAAPDQLRCQWVWQPVAGRQTDLLLGALRDFPPDADWTPVVLASQAGRWTPAQRDQVRDLLSAQVGDPGIPAARRAKAAVSVSRIPGSGDRVLSWAASEEAMVGERLRHGREGLNADYWSRRRMAACRPASIRAPIAVPGNAWARWKAPLYWCTSVGTPASVSRRA
jgi:hypothetical protein